MSEDAGSSPERPIEPHHVRCVRVGHGANCSSMGSVVDILFATAAVGTAVFAAVVAALAKEPVIVAGKPELPRVGDGSRGEESKPRP